MSLGYIDLPAFIKTHPYADSGVPAGMGTVVGGGTGTGGSKGSLEGSLEGSLDGFRLLQWLSLGEGWAPEDPGSKKTIDNDMQRQVGEGGRGWMNSGGKAELIYKFVKYWEILRLNCMIIASFVKTHAVLCNMFLVGCQHAPQIHNHLTTPSYFFFQSIIT